MLKETIFTSYRLYAQFQHVNDMLFQKLVYKGHAQFHNIINSLSLTRNVLLDVLSYQII